MTIQYDNAEVKNVYIKCPVTSQKITQAFTTDQENTGKLIENVISQAVTKPEDITPPNPTLDSRSSQTSNSSYERTTNFNMPLQSHIDMYHLQRPYETHISTCLCKPTIPQPNFF